MIFLIECFFVEWHGTEGLDIFIIQNQEVCMNTLQRKLDREFRIEPVHLIIEGGRKRIERHTTTAISAAN